MSFIYQDDSLQNDPQWKQFEQQANVNMHDHHMKNFKPQCDAPIGSYINDGYIAPPCKIDTDSAMRHGLIENPSVLNPEEIDKTIYHLNSMPAQYNQQCNLRDVQCNQRGDFTFWEATTPSVNPQANMHIFDHQGIGTRHWGRKADNFYKNLDDIQLKNLF